MRKGLVSILLVITFLGCSEENCPPCSTPTDDRVSFEMSFLDYSDNNYFIDEIYADTSSELNIFNQYYGNIPPIVLPEYYVKEIEVYKSINILSGSSIFASVYIDLQPRSTWEKYPDSLRRISSVIPGKVEAGRFSLLSEGRDYLFRPETGHLTFILPLNDQDIIAVAYKIENGSPTYGDLFYGEFFADLIHNSDSIAVLKLVKPKFLKPDYKKAWKLKMRNIYQITPYLGQATDIDLDIYLKKSDGTETNTINDKKLLELFGFDKLKVNGSPGPDGNFDNRIGYTYQKITSEIIFPVLQPFSDNMPSELNEFKYDLLYDTTKVYLSLPENHFVIKGKYKPI